MRLSAAVAAARKAEEIEILLRKPRKSRLMTDRESKPPSRTPTTDNDGKQWRRGAGTHIRMYLYAPRRTHTMASPRTWRALLPRIACLTSCLPSFDCPRREQDEGRRRRKKEPARTPRGLQLLQLPATACHLFVNRYATLHRLL